MTKIDSSLVGAAGEHLVLSKLLSRGFLAAQAPRGTRKVDILVNFFDGFSPCLIQVKTRSRGADKGWHMSAKHEGIRDTDVLYCFVDLEPNQPTVHVIPSLIVAEVLEKDHKIWIETPGKQGQPHNPTDFRRLKPLCAGQEPDWMDEFLEKWELIHP